MDRKGPDAPGGDVGDIEEGWGGGTGVFAAAWGCGLGWG